MVLLLGSPKERNIMKWYAGLFLLCTLGQVSFGAKTIYINANEGGLENTVSDLKNQATKRHFTVISDKTTTAESADIQVVVLSRNLVRVPNAYGFGGYQNYMTVVIFLRTRNSLRDWQDVGYLQVTRNWWRGAAGALMEMVDKVTAEPTLAQQQATARRVSGATSLGDKVGAAASAVNKVSLTCEAYADQWYVRGSDPWRHLYVYCMTH